MKAPQFRINKILISWYLENKRDLPWRRDLDPYRVWLSEIILQQTQVVQGLPYYEKFVTRFPQVAQLADAKEEEVLKLWQGLGYYSRARNLHQTARRIVNDYGGKFPDQFKDLLSLQGVGVYTASAIASICFNRPKAVVDGNVYRVLSRLFGVNEPINQSSGIKLFQELANIQLDGDDPGTYNQAIMEFGALQCTPKLPKCHDCPLNDRCVALATGRISELPVSIKKGKIKTEYYNFLVIEDREGNYVLERRPEVGIWAKLHQFPLIESTTPITQEVVRDHLVAKCGIHADDIMGLNKINSEPVIHRLTHKKLLVDFWCIPLSVSIPESISMTQLATLAVPKVIERFIEHQLPFDH